MKVIPSKDERDSGMSLSQLELDPLYLSFHSVFIYFFFPFFFIFFLDDRSFFILFPSLSLLVDDFLDKPDLQIQ